MSKSFTLPSGQEMPSIGLGVWKLPQDCCAEVVYQAIKHGYRHIDSAADYGNEHITGQGIKRAIDDGLVKREELFVTSKLWNTFHRKEHVELALKKSLEDLGLEYLDLYLVHFPISLKFVPIETKYPPEWKYPEQDKMVYDNVPYMETWQAMEELHEKKLVKNIGVSNINIQLLRDVLTYAKIKPAVNQIEMHPFLSQEKLLRFQDQVGVHTTAYSPLGSASYIEMGLEQKPEEMLINAPIVKEIAEKHGKSTGQVLLRWGLQRGTSVIPKTSRVERLVENFSVFDFELSEEQMKGIDALNKNQRFNDPGNYTEDKFGLFFPIHE